jgi:NADPH:quinone reductase-like Zn-dependent oxidoreductase
MTLPKLMSGVVLTAHGGPETLKWRDDLPVPEPSAGEVVIKVSAAGVNNTDINTRTAWYSKRGAKAQDATWSGSPISFPRIQGIDACGAIAAVGEGVSPQRLGERVLVEPCLLEANATALDKPWFFGSECDGAFAQYTRVAARHAYPIDSDLSDVELASFPCSYSTAENMLTRAAVSAGETVLITGASGGVGSAAVQLARARGATVIAVTNAAKSQAIRELGASRTLLRTDNCVSKLGPNSVDVVIDLVAGETFSSLLDVLDTGGRYAVAGAVAGPIVELDIRTLYLKDLSFFGCTVLEPEVFGSLINLIETSKIKPLVAETFALRDINAAQRAFAEKGYVGKIVLKVG